MNAAQATAPRVYARPTSQQLRTSAPPILPARFHEAGARKSLVEAQVRALLESSSAYHAVGADVRGQIERDLVKISSYAAEMVREELVQSLRIGQKPVLVERAMMEGPGLPGAPAPGKKRAGARALEDFTPAAASNIGRVTGETLRAISFPTFVADLIRGTFQAIVNSTIQQMEAYGQLLANVSRTVDQFMQDNITDHQARDWLAQRYPDHIRIQRDGQNARAVPQEGAEDRPAPNFQLDLGLTEDVSLDESSIEETLVPAARRKLAQSRHQMLATMVLMGTNRIVVTGGKIRATMAFHIDTTDALAQQRATDLDTRVAASGSFGFGPWSASLSASVAYVSSNRSQQTNEMNVSADLTSEVDLRFKSDYFPLDRFVPPAGIAQIQGATAVPSANAPSADALSPGALPDASSPPPPAPPPRRPRTPPPEIRPIGQLPQAPSPPTAPTAPLPVAPPPEHAQPAQPAENAQPAQPTADPAQPAQPAAEPAQPAAPTEPTQRPTETTPSTAQPQAPAPAEHAASIRGWT
jgi:hypothetical protein